MAARTAGSVEDPRRRWGQPGMLEGDGDHQQAAGRLRQVGAVVALVALAVSAAYAGDLFGVRSALHGPSVPEERAPAVGRTAAGTPTARGRPEATRVRSYPWWQTVDAVEGEGSRSAAVTIDEAALQWRLSWSCTSGRFVLSVADGDEPLVDASCPGEDVAYGTTTGRAELTVDAEGPWELVVAQQVDVPLVEPPTAAMQEPQAAVVASGSFYDLDQTGRGQVNVYRLDDGRYAVRLEEFFVTPNVDLEIRLSPLERPTSTREYLSADAALVAVLDATAGSMNFEVPDGIDPSAYRSVVIWCPPIDSAYAAASLEAAG